MTFSKPNRTAATLTKCRTPEAVSPFSGMCTTCLDGCVGTCEIGKSSVRAVENLYPGPFAKITAASEKDYPVDLSHFNIMGTAVGAHGVAEDPDVATFPAVNLEREIGAENKIKVKLPIITAGMGSTNIAADNWEHLAAGAAITGTMIVIGENVVGMDPNSVIENGRVVKAPNLAKRITDFTNFSNGYGKIIVQANVEDTRLGVQEFALQELGVDAVELKWGQGAKNIGGEVKLNSLERALLLKNRGYIVLPDPTLPEVQASYKAGAFSDFERHSRIGFVTEESFHARVAELRSAGAKHVFLKTGSYRPADLARAVKFASDAKLDLLTVDGSGGGTGMSPWRMMNEWGVPVVEIASLLYQYCAKLAAKGKYVPDIAIAGGFTLEDHMFKGLALGAPYTKLIGMARSPLTAAMVGKNVGTMVTTGKVPAEFKKYGETLEQVFVAASEVKNMLGGNFDGLPVGAIGVYSYFKRLEQGLKQFMCGARKFDLSYMTRDDLAALTKEAAEISGIPYIMDVDKEEVEKILG